MLNNLEKIGCSPWYWWGLIALGVAMEAVALIYQYVWDYWPCVLCIHTRIWVMGLIVVSALALGLRRHWLSRAAALALMTLMMAGLLERSWMLLGVERGTVQASCDFNTGLPSWFALDQWFPFMFKVWEACGYTPELVFGITMAEALVVLAAALTLFGAVQTAATLVYRRL